AQLQPAGCAQGDFRYRTAALHPARARAGARRGRGVLRRPRETGFPDAQDTRRGGRVMERKDFLVEIGTEELPPKALRGLAHAFHDNVMNALFAAEGEQALRKDIRGYWYYSPRRLALVLQNLPVATPDVVQERLGPAVQAAFDKDGKPTKAAEGFAASVGANIDQLTRKTTDKGERLAFDVTVAGQQTRDLLPSVVEDALKKLPIPKRMRWGAGNAEFVRPVQWIVMLFGNEVIDGEILGVKSSRHSRGHRFHAPGPVDVRSPA